MIFGATHKYKLRISLNIYFVIQKIYICIQLKYVCIHSFFNSIRFYFSCEKHIFIKKKHPMKLCYSMFFGSQIRLFICYWNSAKLFDGLYFDFNTLLNHEIKLHLTVSQLGFVFCLTKFKQYTLQQWLCINCIIILNRSNLTFFKLFKLELINQLIIFSRQEAEYTLYLLQQQIKDCCNT